jgi:hypothetical protein
MRSRQLIAPGSTHFFWETTLSGDRTDGLALEPVRSRIAGAVPRQEVLFEPVHDRYGWRLALVFGNHAPSGICPYYTGELCYHCDIGAGEGVAFDVATNAQRLDWFRDYYRRHLGSVGHLVIYNSGSVLNPREMPREVLDEILGFARSIPAVRVVSLDSREAHINIETLKRVLSVVGEGIMVRPILGVESADDRIRNEVLRKAMPRAAIMRVFRDLGTLAAEYGGDRIGLDINIVIAGPGTTIETEVDDALRTAELALSAGAQHGVSVDLNLHPYYIGARGSARFPDHRRCSIATTARAAARIALAVRSMGGDSTIFIGWQDEAHDLDQEQRAFELKHARSVFDCFNQTNDPAVFLESWLT